MVSSVPAEIAGIGSTQQRLRVSPGFDPLKAAVGPDEYFVLSRIDGNQSLREILLNSGLPVERAVAIVTRLRSIGALLLPGESAAPAPASPPGATGRDTGRTGRLPQVTPSAATPTPIVTASARPSPVPPPIAVSRAPTPLKPLTTSGSGAIKRQGTNNPFSTEAPSTPPGPVPVPRRAAAAPSSDPPTTGPTAPQPMLSQHDLRLLNPTSDELAALHEKCELDDTARRRILAIARLVDKNDPHGLLGVPSTSDPRDLKRAYFQLSKEIHPDRYYGKQLGTFGARMAEVFEACSRAYTRLTGGEKTRATSPTVSNDDAPQTQQDYAAELFERACNVEIGGEALEAMKLFAAAIRVDPQLRYLRRAANCALIAGQPRTALEYAKKAQNLAPTDPSAARLLATAFRAAGKLSDAEDVLVMAMALKTENDALAAELRHDLAEVRRLLAAQ